MRFGVIAGWKIGPGLLIGLMLIAAGCAIGGAPPALGTSRLAYVGLDGQVYVIPQDGGDARRVSLVPGEPPVPAGDRVTRWPTWAPDGTRLAFMRFDISRVSDDRAIIFVVGADGSGLTKVFESTEEPPIYMAWAPDSSSLTLLTQHGSELRLRVVDPSGVNPPRQVANGGPIYFAWSPDSRRLLLHLNGDHRSVDGAMLSLLQSDSPPEAAEPLAAKPVDFRAPAWSSDGARMAFVAQVPGGQAALSVQQSGAAEATRLAVVGSEPAFLWSPSADRLAFSSRVPGRPILYQGIETIKADGTDRQRVTDADVAAFYWSPDGKKLAYAGVDQGQRALAWFVSDPDGKNRRQVATFVPSDEQVFMFAFFDQYAQSHAVWSPDGRYLVYAGAPPDGPGQATRDPAAGAPQGADDRPSQVFLAAADGNSAPKVLVDGSIALWPVPPSRQK